MSNLNLDLNFFESPPVIRLALKLGLDAAILPLRLGCYVGKHHASDGRLTGYGPLEVEAIAGWRGEKGKMITAMIELGFIGQDGETFYIPQWKEDQGHIEAFKVRAKSMAQKRWDAARNTARNASSITSGIPPGNAYGNALSGQGLAGHVSKTKRMSAAEKTRERLRRENLQAGNGESHGSE